MELLKAELLTKRFPGVTALDRVSLSVRTGEVLAVVGENGAGKSTLMKILAGVERPDAGQIELGGRLVEIASVHQALELGIVLIHQELNLAENLDVGANIFLGREPQRWGFFDRSRIEAQSRRLLASIGLDLSPRTLVERLSIGHRQMVEIAKALSVNARILIMDEPTSSLSQHEAEALFRVVRDLRQRGVSIVYISHRLAEVQQLADRVVVLRDGKNAGELAGGAIRPERMVSLMVGREVSLFAGRRPRTPGKVLLDVKELTTAAHPQHRLSFTVRSHEIVGIAGLVGAGRTELLQALFGIQPARTGTIRVDGNLVLLRHPTDAIQAGLALVPEDRKEQGLILQMTVQENVGLAALRRNARAAAFIDFACEHREAEDMIQKLQLRPSNPQLVVQNLSGGNQQKVVLAKWLLLNPRVLLLDEPTRGVDVGAKEEIYHLIEQTAEAGAAVLFVSSEMPEVLGLADRLLVMHEGRITGELTRPEATEEAVMRLATGDLPKDNGVAEPARGDAASDGSRVHGLRDRKKLP
jgi:ribose transport system ATP-binding protein